MLKVIKKLKGPFALGIVIFLFSANIDKVVQAHGVTYGIYLPKYMGVSYKNAVDGKISNETQGANLNLDIDGSGSYAMDYYMSNDNNERRGDYKTIDQGFYQKFNNWGTYGYNYYLTCMNYSSVSSLVLATGKWTCDGTTSNLLFKTKLMFTGYY